MTLQQIRQRIEKGCGVETPAGFDRIEGYPLYDTCGLKILGQVDYCPSCSAQLSLLSEIEGEMQKEIEGMEFDKAFGEAVYAASGDIKDWDEFIRLQKEELKQKLLGVGK